MHPRRIACFILGLWMGGGLLMTWIAAENERSVDRLLLNLRPEAVLALKPLGSAARAVLRYQAAEQNRYWMESWEMAQIGMGLLFFTFLLFGTRERPFPLLVVGVLVLAVLVQRLLLTPEIASLGTETDFLPAGAMRGEHSRYALLLDFYYTVEIGKLGLGLVLAARFLLQSRRTRSADARQKVDLVDKADYGHIDR